VLHTACLPAHQRVHRRKLQNLVVARQVFAMVGAARQRSSAASLAVLLAGCSRALRQVRVTVMRDALHIAKRKRDVAAGEWVGAACVRQRGEWRRRRRSRTPRLRQQYKEPQQVATRELLPQFCLYRRRRMPRQASPLACSLPRHTPPFATSSAPAKKCPSFPPAEDATTGREVLL